MSLRVWLPLNGTLENKGLSDINLNATPTYVTGGKIGNQCLASQLGWFEIPDMAGKKQMSFAYWVKINTATSTNWLDTFSWYSTDGSTNHRSRQEFYTNSTQTGVWFYGGSIGTTFRNTVGDWNHYVFTIDYDKGEAKFYINGEELATPILTVDTTHYIKGTGSAFLLRESTLDSHINDFRLYDHILSPLEVKQISQGLILHYPLNRNGWGQENFLKKSGFFKTSQGWTNNQSVTISIEDNELKAVINQNTSTPGVKTTIPISLNAGIYTASLLIKVKNGEKDYVNFPFYMNNGSKVIYNGAYTKKEKRGEYIYEEATFTLSSNVENVIFYILSSGILNGETWYIKNIKLELGQKATPWCPNEADELATLMGLNDNVEYDVSGYGNNGTKNNITYTSDTSKYNVSSIFNGTNSYVKVNDNNWMVKGMTEMTVNLWVKATTFPASGRLISCTEGGGFNLEGGNSGYWRFPIYVYTNSEKTSSAYKFDSNEIKLSELILNEWNMITLIYDINGTKTYLNGELHHTYTNISYGINFNTNARLFLGCEANTANPSGPYFNGQESDFRIYATALSAEDVKSLYNNSAYIDNQGNIYGAVYEEV